MWRGTKLTPFLFFLAITFLSSLLSIFISCIFANSFFVEYSFLASCFLSCFLSFCLAVLPSLFLVLLSFFLSSFPSFSCLSVFITSYCFSSLSVYLSFFHSADISPSFFYSYLSSVSLSFFLVLLSIFLLCYLSCFITFFLSGTQLQDVDLGFLFVLRTKRKITLQFQVFWYSLVWFLLLFALAKPFSGKASFSSPIYFILFLLLFPKSILSCYLGSCDVC